MKTLYIECAMGAAGDMLAAALLELLPDRAAFLEKMNGLGIPGVTVSAEKGVKCGVSGTHFPSGWRESRKTRTSIVIITTMFTAAWRALRKS